jgi:hypothetical protein
MSTWQGPAVNGGGGMSWQGCRQRGWRHACHVTTSFYSIPFSSHSKTEHKDGTIPFLKFFQTEHKSKPFHAIGMEPFHSVLPGSRTEHIINLASSHHTESGSQHRQKDLAEVPPPPQAAASLHFFASKARFHTSIKASVGWFQKSKVKAA